MAVEKYWGARLRTHSTCGKILGRTVTDPAKILGRTVTDPDQAGEIRQGSTGFFKISDSKNIYTIGRTVTDYGAHGYGLRGARLRTQKNCGKTLGRTVTDPSKNDPTRAHGYGPAPVNY